MAGVFLTGATGYLGSSLLPALAERHDRVVALARENARPTNPGNLAGTVEWVRADLAGSELSPAMLEGCDLVVHAAAVTGKAAPREYEAVNVEGTRRLLSAARSAGVGRFLFVSSIAAGFSDVRRYPYARSKIAAEALVRESAASWAIVRPTIIVGPGAPVMEALVALARLPLTPLFGGGQARVQPVSVDDVVRALVLMAGDSSFDGEHHDLGGQDVLTMRDLLERLRSALDGKPLRGLHVPAAPLAPVLGALEKVMLPLLPFTAGQMASFTQDGVAAPGPLSEALAPLESLDAVIERFARG